MGLFCGFVGVGVGGVFIEVSAVLLGIIAGFGLLLACCCFSCWLPGMTGFCYSWLLAG